MHILLEIHEKKTPFVCLNQYLMLVCKVKKNPRKLLRANKQRYTTKVHQLFTKKIKIMSLSFYNCTIIQYFLLINNALSMSYLNKILLKIFVNICDRLRNADMTADFLYCIETINDKNLYDKKVRGWVVP